MIILYFVFFPILLYIYLFLYIQWYFTYQVAGRTWRRREKTTEHRNLLYFITSKIPFRSSNVQCFLLSTPDSVIQYELCWMHYCVSRKTLGWKQQQCVVLNRVSIRIFILHWQPSRPKPQTVEWLVGRMLTSALPTLTTTKHPSEKNT